MLTSGNFRTYDYLRRSEELSATFKLGDHTKIDNGLVIRTFPFRSEGILKMSDPETESALTSDWVEENFQFEYPVFMKQGKSKQNQVILLLHGLNERSWDKYLPWAEYLCRTTGKSVLLFPIAYHMNRSPGSWSNPRIMKKLVELRMQLFGKDRSLSIANAALSERLHQNPERFFRSGQQSYHDLLQLINDIKQGKHPLFATDTHVDIFAYSIGALLSQVLLLGDRQGLFSDSKLFMFCGGSVFDRMFGQSRSIMDRFSFEKLLSFYKSDKWLDRKVETSEFAHEAFNTMLTCETRKTERHHFFKSMGNRMEGVSLALDTVIPYRGIVEAIGHESASKKIRIIDFSFDYSHENPFPQKSPSSKLELNSAFLNVFEHAAAFLCK